MVPLTLNFAAEVNGVPAACGQSYQSLGLTGATAQLADGRLFVSGLQVHTDDGSEAGLWQDVVLDEDGAWQSSGVALLDFEDGTGACGDSGSPETRTVVTGQAVTSFDAVRFNVGLPFGLNHLNSATQPAPLNTPGMFWAWKAGYKFLRVDWSVAPDGQAGGAVGTGVSTPTAPSRWNIHVGSGQCASPAKTTAPEAPCGRPNLATVELTGFDGTQSVVLNLGALVANAAMSENTADTPPGCMSQGAEPLDCSPVFQSLGMDFATGVPATTVQSVFSLR